MSEQQSSNGGFAKAFVPGLVLGLVIGAFVGATLPPLLSSGNLPERSASPTNPGPRDAFPETDPVVEDRGDETQTSPGEGDTPPGGDQASPPDDDGGADDGANDGAHDGAHDGEDGGADDGEGGGG